MIPISKPQIGEAEKRAVLDVLDSGMLVQGPRVAELEKRWAERCQTRHAIALSNGTAALHTSLLAHGIGPGDEVITSSFTFIASVNSILFTGARPVFVDILPCCFNVNPDLIEAAITPRTKAIMPIHLFGYPAQMDRITAIAERHNLRIIEDAAQAIGGAYDGQPTGSFGTGCFSLYATKNVHSGEGGMITTNDDAIARSCRLIRSHGMERRYYHDVLGYNFRMSDLHAAIGIEQLKKLDHFTASRRKNAAFLNAHIRNARVAIPAQACMTLPRFRASHVWHQYTVRIIDGDRDGAIRALTEAGIGTGVFYPVPAHQQKHIVAMGLGNVVLPETERASREVLSLPVHPGLSDADLETIVAAVNRL